MFVGDLDRREVLAVVWSVEDLGQHERCRGKTARLLSSDPMGRFWDSEIWGLGTGMWDPQL